MSSTLFIKDRTGVSVNPVTLFIPEFKAVWDKHKDKSIADKELAYVYFVADYKSDYSSYGNDKPIAVAKDIMPEDWKPDKITNDAVEKYKELQKTTSIRFLEWARMSMCGITDYFREMAILETDSTAVKKKKMSEFDPEKTVKLLKDVEPILTKLDKIEEKVLREEGLGENKIRGGGDIGFFEDPEAMKFV
jgi:hypothetical protein